MATIARLSVSMLLLLLATSCTQKVNESPLSLDSMKGQSSQALPEPAEAREPLAELASEDLAPLELGTPASDEMRARLQHSSRVTPFQTAGMRVRMVTGQYPTDMSDLAPYLFLWPCAEGDCTQSAQVVDVTAPARAQSETHAGRSPAALLRFQGSTLHWSWPGQPELNSSMVPAEEVDPDRDYLRTRRSPLQLAELRPERSRRATMTTIFDYLNYTAVPDDARLGAATRQLMHWMHKAAGFCQTLPRSLAEAQQCSGLLLQHLDPAPAPEQAALVIYTNGDAAWRLVVRLDNGITLDLVHRITRFENSSMTARALPTELYAVAFPEASPWELLGAWNLAE